MNGRNGNGQGETAKKRRTVLAKPTKAQLAARERFVLESGVKVTPEDVAAIVAELEALR
ncbi:MAG: hypothetical protein ABSF69_26535 [Polyangiaceae bacterium]|jgi:hypothetical protein